MLFSGLPGGLPRPSRDTRHTHRGVWSRHRPNRHANKRGIILCLFLFLSLVFLPSNARGATLTVPTTASDSSPASMPLVTGTDTQ